MTRTYVLPKRPAPGVAFVSLALFLACLWVAGGASRADVFGQVVVRAVAWIILIVTVLVGTGPHDRGSRPVLYLLLGAIALVILQLIPLPPDWWGSLSGRDAFAPVRDLTGAAAWRPMAIVPSAAENAIGALVVPLAAYFLIIRAGPSTNGGLVATLLGLVVATALVGLVQLAGVPLENPLVNASREASGTFANRNHFALFLAIGCLLAPVWALHGRTRLSWRVFAAAGLIPLFLLMILASGSRAGIGVGAVALAGGGTMAWLPIQRMMRDRPRWIIPAVMIGFMLLMLMLGLLSYDADRATSVQRAMTASVDIDMRRRGLPVVLAMIREYFPFGAGFGGFDALFRLHEPDSLLKPTYFNRAHNDFLEIVLDGGVAGAALIISGAGWWLWRSIIAWRSVASDMLSRLGSLMILLIGLASVFDYPARTPMIMATLVIAGIWLGQRRDVAGDRL